MLYDSVLKFCFLTNLVKNRHKTIILVVAVSSFFLGQDTVPSTIQ